MKNWTIKRTMQIKKMGETIRERALRLWKNQDGDSESTGTVVLIIGALVVGAILIGLLVALFKTELFPLIEQTIENLFDIT